MDSFTENGELFISEEFSKEIQMKITGDFNKVMINGIKLREGYDIIEDVLTALIREHMDSLGDIEQQVELSLYETQQGLYMTQATNKEEVKMENSKTSIKNSKEIEQCFINDIVDGLRRYNDKVSLTFPDNTKDTLSFPRDMVMVLVNNYLDWCDKTRETKENRLV